MNFGELKTAVLGYLQNTDQDLIDNLPIIVNRTQERLRTLKVPAKEKRVYQVGPEFTLPPDFEEIKEIWIQSERNPATGQYDEDYPKSILPHLRPVSWQQMTQWLELDGGGRPQYFARTRDESNNSILRVFPNGTQIDGGQWSIEMTYYQKPASVVNDSDTNVYFTEFFDLMLYGSVAEGYRWLRTEDKMAVWEEMFQGLYQDIVIAGRAKDYQGGTVTTGSPYQADAGRPAGW